MARKNRKSLLQGVIESPDEYAPRLAYADFLEKNGEEDRAEFIRVQCKLDALGEDHPQRVELKHREQELLDEFGWTWAEEFGTTISEWVFRRGFIERVETCLETSGDQITALLSKAPIRHIRDISQFCDFEGVVDALPEMHRLTGIEFWYLYAFDNVLVRQMLGSPHLAGLRTLIFHHDRNGNMVDDEVLIEGLHSPHRSRLEELAVNVDGCWRGPSVALLQAIADSPFLRSLKKLNLCNAGDTGNRPGLTVDAVHTLAHSPNLQGLEELDLGQCSCEPPVVDALLDLVKRLRLNSLRLCNARVLNSRGYTKAYLADLPKIRKAFEACVPNVDWTTEYVTPWDGNCWSGISWKQRSRQLLFRVDEFIRRRDFDGLESQYRTICRTLEGDAEAERISNIDFAPYAAAFDAGLRKIQRMAKKQNASSIVLRISPDLSRGGEFHAHSDVPLNDEPREEMSWGNLITTVPMEKFGDRLSGFNGMSKGTQSNGSALYSIARAVATIGRCLKQQPSPLPFYVSFTYAIFRMNRT